MLVGLAALAVPSIFVLLLEFFGWYRRRSRRSRVRADGRCSTSPASLAHHDVFVRSVIALAGALLFATAALLVLIPAWNEAPAPTTGDAAPAQLRLDARGDRRRAARRARRRRRDELAAGDGGDRAFPRRAARARASAADRALLYLFDRRFGSGIERPRDVFLSPVLAYQLLGRDRDRRGSAALMLVRSGNDSDVSPSPFELALRHALTPVLSVRPRFKEFLIGFPCMMLLPALLAAHRRASAGCSRWASASASATSSTRSRTCTRRSRSRCCASSTDSVVGAIIGALLIWIYRASPCRARS